MRDVVLPSFLEQIVRPNPSFQFDTFVHNGEVDRREQVRELWRPRAMAIGEEGVQHLPVSLPGTNGWASGFTPRLFASIESVLNLKRAAEARGDKRDVVE